MNKNRQVLILTVIVVLLIGFIVWQNINSKPKTEEVVNIPKTNTSTVPTNYLQNKTENVVDNKNEVNPILNPITKVTVPAKDAEALKSKFTFEVPVSKILDKKWQWLSAINYDDSVFAPKKSAAFSLTFKKDGTFSGTTDCNGIFGKYTTKGSVMTLTSIGQTMMFCEGSEEVKFTTYLNQVRGFMFNGDEELVLSFEFDSGSMVFK
jgi:heat shock protein HslJ